MSARTATPLLIFPCNGNGLEALDCLDDTYRFIGFIDDTPEKQGVDPGGPKSFCPASTSSPALKFPKDDLRR